MAERKSTASMASDPTAVEFVRDVLQDVEDTFAEHFGDRWIPEIQELYQTALTACVTAAHSVDARLAEREKIMPVRAKGRVLTNHPAGRNS